MNNQHPGNDPDPHFGDILERRLATNLDAIMGEISAGMWKRLRAVSGVSTKPGLIRLTPMPAGRRSVYSVSARLISAALVGP